MSDLHQKLLQAAADGPKIRLQEPPTSPKEFAALIRMETGLSAMPHRLHDRTDDEILPERQEVLVPMLHHRWALDGTRPMSYAVHIVQKAHGEFHRLHWPQYHLDLAARVQKDIDAALRSLKMQCKLRVRTRAATHRDLPWEEMLERLGWPNPCSEFGMLSRSWMCLPAWLHFPRQGKDTPAAHDVETHIWSHPGARKSHVLFGHCGPTLIHYMDWARIDHLAPHRPGFYRAEYAWGFHLVAPDQLGVMHVQDRLPYEHDPDKEIGRFIDQTHSRERLVETLRKVFPDWEA